MGSSGSAAKPQVTFESVTKAKYMEDEPQWSLYAPTCQLTAPAPGKPRSFEIEEEAKGWFRIRGPRKETLQADNDDDYKLWTEILKEVLEGRSNEATVSSLPSSARPSEQQ